MGFHSTNYYENVFNKNIQLVYLNGILLLYEQDFCEGENQIQGDIKFNFLDGVYCGDLITSVVIFKKKNKRCLKYELFY